MSKRLTSVFVQSRETEFFQKLDKYIRDRPDLANQPALLPLIAAQIEYQATDSAFNRYRSEMGQFEDNTGYGQLIGKSTPKPLDPFEIDLPGMTKKLNNFSSKVFVQSERISSCLLRHEKLTNFLNECSAHVPDYQLDGRSAAQLVEMEFQAEFMANGWKCLQMRYDAFSKNMQVLIAVVRLPGTSRSSADFGRFTTSPYRGIVRQAETSPNRRLVSQLPADVTVL